MAISNFRKRLTAVCAFALIGATSVIGSSDAKTVVIQRTTIYISTLPTSCVKRTFNGGSVIVWKCGALFYMPYGGRYVRVYIK